MRDKKLATGGKRPKKENDMNVGDAVPNLTLEDADGKQVSLANLAAPLVVYFYPKADTPGCTVEAQDFTELGKDFASAGITVVGISKDKVPKLAKFRDKYDLGVTLLSDEDGKACEAFGTWIQKKLYGREYMGIDRATFLFDKDGKLVQEWRKVKVKGHAAAVLEAAKAL